MREGSWEPTHRPRCGPLRALFNSGRGGQHLKRASWFLWSLAIPVSYSLLHSPPAPTYFTVACPGSLSPDVFCPCQNQAVLCLFPFGLTNLINTLVKFYSWFSERSLHTDGLLKITELNSASSNWAKAFFGWTKLWDLSIKSELAFYISISVL